MCCCSSPLAYQILGGDVECSPPLPCKGVPNRGVIHSYSVMGAATLFDVFTVLFFAPISCKKSSLLGNLYVSGNREGKRKEKC